MNKIIPLATAFIACTNRCFIRPRTKHALFVLFLILPFFLLSSCKKTSSCEGMGTLNLENISVRTVQKLMVDGASYGTIDPGESKDISLAAGEHSYQFVGISGGSGCSVATVIIVECKTFSSTCNN